MGIELNKSIADTVCSDQVGDFIAEYLEIGLDALLKDGLVKDIPFLGSVAKVYDIGNNISNRIFANKILTVLSNFGKLNELEKEKIKQSLFKTDENKIGEQVILLTDKLESYEKAAMLGKILKAYLVKNINKAEYESMSFAVLNIFLGDANLLLLPPIEIQKQDFNSTARLYQLSLFECPLEVIDENGSEVNGKKYCLSHLGVKFVNIVLGKNILYEEKDERGSYYQELGLTSLG